MTETKVLISCHILTVCRISREALALCLLLDITARTTSSVIDAVSCSAHLSKAILDISVQPPLTKL